MKVLSQSSSPLPLLLIFYNRQKVLTFGIYHNGFSCLINSSGLSSLYLHWDLSYLLALLTFQEVCLVAKLLLEDIYKCFWVSNLFEKKWLHSPGIKIMSQKETALLQKTQCLKKDYLWPDPFPVIPFTVFLLSSDFRFDRIAARTFSFI